MATSQDPAQDQALPRTIPRGTNAVRAWLLSVAALVFLLVSAGLALLVRRSRALVAERAEADARVREADARVAAAQAAAQGIVKLLPQSKTN